MMRIVEKTKLFVIGSAARQPSGFLRLTNGLLHYVRNDVLKGMLVLVVAISATQPTHATPTSTDRFLLALTDELEAKVIGDDELVALIASADAGRLANPICEATAELSAARLLAYQGFQQYVDGGDLDAAAIAAWARANLVEQERGRARREENRKATTLPWKVESMLLSNGGIHACAVNAERAVTCWGYNEDGQCTPPSDLGEVRSISAGISHSCAIKMDGSVRCWGANNLRQLEIPSELGAVQSVSVGLDIACAIKAGGSVACWGNKGSSGVTPLPGLTAVRSVSASQHTCVVQLDGKVDCWGYNSSGQTEPPSDLGVVQSVSAGGFHSCAVKASGDVKCWGDNLYGQSTPPADLGAVQSISAGNTQTCAVTLDSSVRCWGHSSRDPQATPNLGPVHSVSVGFGYVCAAKVDGRVKCWGASDDGQLKVPKGLIVESSGSKP